MPLPTHDLDLVGVVVQVLGVTVAVVVEVLEGLEVIILSVFMGLVLHLEPACLPLVAVLAGTHVKQVALHELQVHGGRRILSFHDFRK